MDHFKMRFDGRSRGKCSSDRVTAPPTGLVEADGTVAACPPLQFMATRHTPAVTPLARLRGASALTSLGMAVAATKCSEQP